MVEVEAVWCSTCVRVTKHEVLHDDRRADVVDEEIMHEYTLLACRGCGTVCLIHRWFGSHDDEILEEIENLSDEELENHERNPRGTFERVYPSRVSRREPEWIELFALLGNRDERKMVDLFREIYAAVDGGQHRLAAMGIRALLEQVMIMKVGDIGGFDKKLDAFEQAGLISPVQHDAMRTTLDVGDAAMHRGFIPSRDQLNTCLDIVEGVMSLIYLHLKEADEIKKAVPRRTSKLWPVRAE